VRVAARPSIPIRTTNEKVRGPKRNPLVSQDDFRGFQAGQRGWPRRPSAFARTNAPVGRELGGMPLFVVSRRLTVILCALCFCLVLSESCAANTSQLDPVRPRKLWIPHAHGLRRVCAHELNILPPNPLWGGGIAGKYI
jgi:hypothetical protein